ncbi:DUF4252 domain-containing protein [Cellulophaga sp. HaHaR_3_176]|uniref:DUF4252 domain-containing protein n=1 Tax=Cellulophaga sp. HaHaR_3_176 TaxID=1942464 RepID=UPI001C1FFE56|nr:DUF4252 domain-containing protein [Cellulophaga sp. HaHaR_3_176]QWX82618.1 DUF4252 domain-containing protein [Cellulophaga sp. HaHaR_3_176]
MKKSLIIILMAMLPSIGVSQSLFDKYEDSEKVTSVIVSKSMFNLLSKIDVEVDDAEAQNFMDIAKSVSSLKVFTTEDKIIGSDMAASVSSYLKSSSLEELMRIKDEDANVKFYVKSGKDDDHVSELLMFITGVKNVNVDGRKFETVLLSLTGDIDLNKINSLTSKMNLPKELNKAGKNK